MKRNVAIIEDQPLNLHEMRALSNKEKILTVIVRLKLDTILKSKCENICELLEEKITDEYPGIEEYTFEICGYENDAILVEVTGSVASILKEADLRDQQQG